MERMPICLYLGDFLQLRPTGGFSLIDNLQELERRGRLPADFAPEWNMAMKLFCQTPRCFELQASNRFKDPQLRALMNFIREPRSKIPADVQKAWDSIQMQKDDH